MMVQHRAHAQMTMEQRRAAVIARQAELDAAAEADRAAEAARQLGASFAQGCDPLRERASKQTLQGVVLERQAQVLLRKPMHDLAYCCGLAWKWGASTPLSCKADPGVHAWVAFRLRSGRGGASCTSASSARRLQQRSRTGWRPQPSGCPGCCCC